MYNSERSHRQSPPRSQRDARRQEPAFSAFRSQSQGTLPTIDLTLLTMDGPLPDAAQRSVTPPAPYRGSSPHTTQHTNNVATLSNLPASPAMPSVESPSYFEDAMWPYRSRTVTPSPSPSGTAARSQSPAAMPTTSKVAAATVRYDADHRADRHRSTSNGHVPSPLVPRVRLPSVGVRPTGSRETSYPSTTALGSSASPSALTSRARPRPPRPAGEASTSGRQRKSGKPRATRPTPPLWLDDRCKLPEKNLMEITLLSDQGDKPRLTQQPNGTMYLCAQKNSPNYVSSAAVMKFKRSGQYRTVTSCIFVEESSWAEAESRRQKRGAWLMPTWSKQKYHHGAKFSPNAEVYWAWALVVKESEEPQAATSKVVK